VLCYIQGSENCLVSGTACLSESNSEPGAEYQYFHALSGRYQRCEEGLDIEGQEDLNLRRQQDPDKVYHHCVQ